MSKKLLFILIFSMFIFRSFSINTDTINTININKLTLVETAKTTDFKFSVENLNKYLKEKGIDDTSYIIAQFSLESGNFKSNLFINSNNICGMKSGKKRKATVIGRTKSGYAKYANWTNSVDDFLSWLERHSLNPNSSTYIYKLKQKHYNNSSKYANLILKTRSQIKKKYSNIF